MNFGIQNKLKIRFSNWILKLISTNIYIHGDKERVHIGKNTSLVNSLFNTSSGHIYIGDDTIFGHNCMLLTGKHFNGNHKHIDFNTLGMSAIIEENILLSN